MIEIKGWDLYKPWKVCKIYSQEVQDEGLCKSEYSNWVWSKYIKEWWKEKDKLFNIWKPSWDIWHAFVWIFIQSMTYE